MLWRAHPEWLLLGVIVLDQASKWLATRLHWVNLNRGIAFGWGQNFSLYLSIVMIFAITMICLYSWRKRRFQFQSGLLLILAGGISNLLDRLIWGGVRDFIPMIWWHNNLADIAIVVGLGLFLVRIYQSGKISQKNYV